MPVVLEGPLATADRPPLGDACPIERTAPLLARASTLVLLREAAYGTARFDDFVARSGLSESVVAAQLRLLVAEGLLAKRPYREAGQRARAEYVLTAAGDDLVPILLALAQWGDRHRPERHRLQVVHTGCGAPVDTTVHCGAGHALTTEELTVSVREGE
ncbi:winged helix-turn-helix transcriptional regulator [Microbacterium sp. GXF7504]